MHGQLPSHSRPLSASSSGVCAENTPTPALTPEWSSPCPCIVPPQATLSSPHTPFSALQWNPHTPKQYTPPFLPQSPSTCSQLSFYCRKQTPLSFLALENAFSLFPGAPSLLSQPLENTLPSICPLYDAHAPLCLPSTHTFPFWPPQPTSLGLSPVKYTTFSYGGLWNTQLSFRYPSQRKTQSPLLHPWNAGCPPKVPPGVKQAPSSPYGRRLPFPALQNVGVGPPTTQPPCPPEHTSPEHPL